MFRTPTRTKLSLANVAVAVSVGTAFAGEGNGPSFPGCTIPDVVLGRTTVLPAPVGARGVAIGSTLTGPHVFPQDSPDIEGRLP